jgi:NAD(P)-dependent dehydrogenase (short-subunit alcohol dehydrogenase family)
MMLSDSMKNKVVAISGANAGIGFETAKSFLEMGATVLMFCRNLEKAELAKQELIAETANSLIDIFLVDFESFTSVEKACLQCAEKYQQIDVLINNAGAMFADYKLTPDGVERTLAVNHFGYYLMTYFMLPLLKNAPRARVVNVASRAHYGVSFEAKKVNEKSYFNFRNQYKISKLCNILFTQKAAEKLRPFNITVNSLDPGLVKTAIGLKTGNSILTLLWKLFSLRGISAKEGAETSVYLATSDEVAEISGQYFELCKACSVSEEAQKQEFIEACWRWTEEFTQIRW